MKTLLAFSRSSVGRKWIVALTGLVLIAYVLGHLAGNLQIFWSPQRINAYAEFLHSLGPILWAIRAFLLAVFVLHIVTTIQLAIQNRAARGLAYKQKRSLKSTVASRTMITSGLIVLSFVVYHLLHFTTRDALPPEVLQAMHDKHDVYNMVLLGFRNPLATGFYLLGVSLLCMHLSHGFSSFLQTLGLTSRGTIDALVLGGRLLAWLIFLGYASIPIASLAGWLPLAQR